jgi:amino acid transporter
MTTQNLKANCLSYTELLAQAVALISPTMTAALIIPVMFGNTGNWSWCSYALGTLMLLFVAFNLNQFARRSTGSGSMYAYICRGLGINAGAIGGWSLLWAYLGIATAGVTGFTIFSGKLLAMAGIDAPPLLLSAICVAAAWFCAWKNVQLSAIMMLVCEGLSMLLIVGL